MNRLAKTGGAVVAACLLASCVGADRAEEAVEAQDRRVENLRAFAKLYGYVRYFHPSDEAAATDWERFAVYGAGRVLAAGGPAELRATLDELFGPIAPTVELGLATEAMPPSPVLVRDSTEGLEVVAWQHLGLGSAGRPGPYRSKRTGRTLEVSASTGGFAPVTQGIPADVLRGRRVKLSAWVRAEVGGSSSARLWLRVDLPDQRMGFFDNMQDRPITEAEWRRYEIEGEVAPNAESVFFGGFLAGTGAAWFDDFELLVDDGGEWQPVTIENAGFEAATLEGWSARAPDYACAVAEDRPHGGTRAARIASRAESVVGPLFDERPEVGEAIERDLGGGVACRVPLALWSRDGHTLGEPRGSLAELERALAGLGTPTLDDPAARLGAVVVAWNVLEHFYPYFDVVEVDWDAALRDALARALADEGAEDLLDTLERLIARLGDGHAGVYSGEIQQGRAGLPLRVELVEDRLVVTASADPAVRRGDLMLEIDGVAAMAALRARQDLVSGSPQWKRARALAHLGQGPTEEPAALRLERGGETIDVRVARRDVRDLPEFDRPSLSELERGIWYVDLSRATMEQIEDEIDAIAAAPGVVFDLRGYPNGNHMVLTHLLTEKDTSGSWMRVPRIIYPDHERVAGWEEHGWFLEPSAPHIRGRVVFVTGGGAISYAESVMGFVERYRLGEIVGGPTAGANGNVNVTELPGGLRMTWTGMKVVHQDGSRLHGLGIQPTVPTERTLAGVLAGRDELLERALSLID